MASHDRQREFEELLLRGRNADGGWAYHPGKASRLEPTCWALLALNARGADATVLENWPTTDGILLERSAGSPNYAYHAVGLLVLRALGLHHTGGNAALLAGLQRAKGEALPPSKANRQDNTLQGWSWIPGTFSWVEPTAWCLLALKQWRQASDAFVQTSRVEEGERLLIDRCGRTGGWNYGNSNVFGQELKSFVPTTAIGLLSMQDRAGVPEIARSVEFLERHGTDERSGVALALALMALRAFGRSGAAVRDALIDQIPTTRAFGNQMAAAMTLYALSEGRHDAVVF